MGVLDMGARENSTPRNLRKGPAQPAVQDLVQASEHPGSRMFKRVGRVAQVVIGVLLVVAASLGAAYGAKIYVTRSHRFAIRTVTVEGASKLTPEAVAALGQVAIGANIFGVDVNDAARKIQTDPYVAKATVTRRLPGTVAISIVEREPRALALIGEALFMVTAEGEIFKKLTAQDARDYMVITGIAEQDLAEDRAGALEKARKALEVANQFANFEYLKRYSLQEIHISKDGALSAVIGKEAIVLSLGHPPVRGKLQQAERVLQELNRRKGTADVIFVDNDGSPDRVVVRMR